MKKIIVPVDFSKYSKLALQTAIKLAKKHQAELLLLHMLEIPDVMLTASNNEQNEKTVFYLQLAEKRMANFLKEEDLVGLKVTPIIKHFKVFSEINEVALKNGADLIVMGSQGATGLKEVFVGSNTERVVRYAEIPVLVVKDEVADVDFGVVTFASDFSEKSIPSYLKAIKFLKKIASKICLVYVNLPNEAFKSSLEMEKQVASFFKKAGDDLTKAKDVYYISDYSVEDGVLNFSNKTGANLIALPTHGKKGLTHFFQGSIGEDVVNHATLPVITFKM